MSPVFAYSKSNNMETNSKDLNWLRWSIVSSRCIYSVRTNEPNCTFENKS